jgi:hypothetical protein
MYASGCGTERTSRPGLTMSARLGTFSKTTFATLSGVDRKSPAEGQTDARTQVGHRFIRRLTRFGRFAAGVSELTIAPGGLL